MVRTPVLRFRAGQPQSSLSLGPQAFLGLAVGCLRSHLKKKVTWHPGGNEARQRLFPPDDARLSEPGRQAANLRRIAPNAPIPGSSRAKEESSGTVEVVTLIS